MLKLSGGRREAPVGVEIRKAEVGYRWDVRHSVALQLAGLRLNPQRSSNREREKVLAACALLLVIP
jgi:hypothetical protein